jgi:UDP-glucose 4-epimerase
VAKLIGFKLNITYTRGRPQEVYLANCSADKARRLLDYKPRVSLEDGLRQMIDYIRTRGPRPFKYHLDLEIINEKTPDTWSKRLF